MTSVDATEDRGPVEVERSLRVTLLAAGPVEVVCLSRASGLACAGPVGAEFSRPRVTLHVRVQFMLCCSRPRVALLAAGSSGG